MEIGRKILNLRKDQEIPQRNLAEDADVTPSALSRIEAGIHMPKGPVTLLLARRLGTTADYVLDESAPYPPPAYEILANLVDTTADEPRETPTMVSERELRVIEAFRSLELERKRFLEAVLNGTRAEVRLAAWVLGAELPGEDPREITRYRDRLRALASQADAPPAAENSKAEDSTAEDSAAENSTAEDSSEGEEPKKSAGKKKKAAKKKSTSSKKKSG